MAVLAGVFVIFQRSSQSGWTSVGPAEKALTVTVPDGATLAAAARALEKAGAIPSTTRFLRDARKFGSPTPIKAGEYEIPAHASEMDIYALLQDGRTVQRLVTIPEGMPSVMVRDRLMAQPALTGDVALPAEGSVLPDSYSFEKGEPRAAVLKRMQAAMTRALDAEWAKRKPTSVVQSKHDAVTLASIVEKETAKPSERRLVAAVYSNRLHQGMKLQADPTIIYPMTQGRPLGRRIRRSEVQAVNGYNTYAMTGLPKGPIANPSRASIAAVLDPETSKALYFVADGTGGHVFAETLAQHNANVQKWYALRRRRGEM
ncbi:MAG: endolytic transglycosylase MltG [Sphingomonadales bacterium]|nr:MAG: endolytic transglycosylase MltG [Sphingomonadales bacterium]